MATLMYGILGGVTTTASKTANATTAAMAAGPTHGAIGGRAIRPIRWIIILDDDYYVLHQRGFALFAAKPVDQIYRFALHTVDTVV